MLYPTTATSLSCAAPCPLQDRDYCKAASAAAHRSMQHMDLPSAGARSVPRPAPAPPPPRSRLATPTGSLQWALKRRAAAALG